MKKLFVVFSIISLLLLLTGCPPPPTSSDHPLLQNNANWVCDNPDMHFEINLNDFYVGDINDKEVFYYDFPGIINKDGVMTEIRASITGTSSINFYTIEKNDAGNRICYGQCKLKNDVLTIEITQQREDGIIDRSIEKLVFTKQDLEDETDYE